MQNNVLKFCPLFNLCLHVPLELSQIYSKTQTSLIGRVSAFTSGAENPHRVERVTDGVRLAFTMGFTCNKENAISDPSLP